MAKYVEFEMHTLLVNMIFEGQGINSPTRVLLSTYMCDGPCFILRYNNKGNFRSAFHVMNK